MLSKEVNNGVTHGANPCLVVLEAVALAKDYSTAETKK